MLCLWTRLIRNVCFLVFLPVPYGGVSKLKSKQQPTWQKEVCPMSLSVCICAWAWYQDFGDHAPWGPSPPHWIAVPLRGLGREILVSCALNNAIRQRQSASHIMLGIYASTCEICICNKGFSEFGVFNLPSALGSVVFSLVIQCPHHFFLMEMYFYLFQCEKKKKGKYVLFEMTFITSIGNTGDLHTLTILLVISSLSERELGRCVLLGHLCQQPLLCSIEKGRAGRFFQQVSFLLVSWYETQPLRSEIWRCVSNRHQKFIVFCTIVIFMWLPGKDWIPMAAS